MSPQIKTDNNIASSYKVYKNELDTYESSSDLSRAQGCNDFNSEHINSSKYDDNKVCVIAIKFLNHLKEKHDISYEEDGCKYLYYWLYVEALENKTSIENTLDLYKKFNDIFNSDNDGNHMFDKYINKLNKYACLKLEKLIRMFEIFNKFESEQTSQGAEKKWTSDCADLFTTYVDECKKAYDYDFCNKLKIFGEQYNFFIQKVQHCEGDQYLLPPLEIFDTVRMVIVPFVLILITFLISPLLYKFTAVGSLIHHILAKKKNVRDNIVQKKDHTLNNYEMDKDDSKKRYYMLSYNST
ncbi:PIR protein [Plasmodium ovale]|uniref:PIR protein n=1 Tax=Plasmodium ovale TaxID=36330 RepID=A0A1D3JDQ4_PLAOA|nr:PIR protein [Plasmodium ovale]